VPEVSEKKEKEKGGETVLTLSLPSLPLSEERLRH
jgi:hypothetical protein